MTVLRLVAPETEEGPFSAGTPLPRRLPPGRHGIPANLVRRHQRLRLLEAMAEALSTHGYADVTTTHVSELATVSTSTFYKHFGNLWDCLLAAYVAAADRLCEAIEAGCAAADEVGVDTDPVEAGIEGALSVLAAEPEIGLLLGTPAPREASALCAARRLLVSRLAAMLRRRRDRGGASQPPGLDERLIDATLAFVHARICAGEGAQLPGLARELVAILDRPRAAA